MGLRKLGDDFYIYPGSPSTGFKVLEDGLVLIDPAHGKGRHKDLLREARKLEKPLLAQVATHGHADHIAVSRKIDVPLYTHRFEFSIAESPLAREVLTFGSRAPEGFLAYSIPDEVRVHGIFEWGDRLFGLEVVGLPGHSPGMSGFLSDGVIYAGDSFFGERLLETVGLPYLLDVGAFLDSLKVLEELALSGVTLVPSHGPVVSGEEALSLISANGERVTVSISLSKELLRKPLSVDELALALMKALSVEPSPKKLALNLVPVRAIIAHLYNLGEIKAVVENGLKWVARRD
ncbi:MBL fold metallo-hydrolase [Thermococcus sp.]|uniref:MBL fold metallo-hydrolase n=1 Tax=Thermococcus sp. TaxID=35749 RepID=UPI002606B59B|nr:MBL fold metallo-hydrolase [Thermococcus sp.]